MLPFPLKTRQRLLLAAGAVAAAALVAAYGLGLVPGRDGERPREAEVARQDARIKIAASTDLVQTIIYLKCGDEEVFRTKPADNLIGLNAAQVQKIYAGWTMDRFDVHEVAMSLKVDSYCREHANNMFLGIKDGYVAVYYGKPGPRAIVREVTRIPLQRLSAEDVEELRRGMVLKSREELLRTLEGMQAQ